MSGPCDACGSVLEKPGDFCLACRSENADAVVVDCSSDRTTITILDGDAVVGETIVTTVPEDGELAQAQRRNFAGRIADEVRRKRPESVFLAGDRDTVRAVRADLHYDCYRVDGDPVEAALARGNDRDLVVVDEPPAAKIGGSHSTMIGGRVGRRAVEAVASHPHVKKVVPGPIQTGGNSSVGTAAKATRADENGNVRLLLRGGSSVQENRVVTTAMNRELGERIREDLGELIDDALDG